MAAVTVEGPGFRYFDLFSTSPSGARRLERLPYTLRLLLENLLRFQFSPAVTPEQIAAIVDWDPAAEPTHELAFHPARVVLQDFTGVPAVVDLSAMRDALADLGGDPSRINPLFPSELVIDHSVQVDSFGHPDSLTLNVNKEYERNTERYQLLRWAQTAFKNFLVVPPATGIVHQVNLEYLARLVMLQGDVAYPDTLVGTDSHTTMINGLGILGWGVGGIEAEAAMLGQPINLLLPQVVGVKLTGVVSAGVTATDTVLTLTKVLRDHGVVGKFVEFFGQGLDHVSVETRATIANMSPEFGSTCAFFPVDAQTLKYLSLTGRSAQMCQLIFDYYSAQGLFRTAASPDPTYSTLIEFDLGKVVPTISGPKRPQDKTLLSEAKSAWHKAREPWLSRSAAGDPVDPVIPLEVAGQGGTLSHGSVVIAAITSCTNTSNPHVMVAAGLLARAAAQRGLHVKPWVKSSLAPGSKAVTGYLEHAGLLADLATVGFALVGYGCTTCIGNSGPLPDEVAEVVREHKLAVVSVLSGNRNFEGRINPDVRANYLMSPPLVVAYALAGTMDIDLLNEPLGKDSQDRDVFLHELWPSPERVDQVVQESVTVSAFSEAYATVLQGDEVWQSLPTAQGDRYLWSADSTYIQKPPFFSGVTMVPPPVQDLEGARALLVLGDTITTDHISPAGSIQADSPAGRYLIAHGISPRDFNSYGARRGNHEVMMRGTFANVRINNALAQGKEGGYSRHLPSGELGAVFDVAMRYQSEGTPLVILGGKDYGSGSSRDWAAKGTLLLGVRAVLAESFERIHRSNLVGMGVLPLSYLPGENRETLGLTGQEYFSLRGLTQWLAPGAIVKMQARRDDGSEQEFWVKVRIDTQVELAYFQNGGILPFVLRQLALSPVPG